MYADHSLDAYKENLFHLLFDYFSPIFPVFHFSFFFFPCTVYIDLSNKQKHIVAIYPMACYCMVGRNLLFARAKMVVTDSEPQGWNHLAKSKMLTLRSAKVDCLVVDIMEKKIRMAPPQRSILWEKKMFKKSFHSGHHRVSDGECSLYCLLLLPPTYLLEKLQRLICEMHIVLYIHVLEIVFCI